MPRDCNYPPAYLSAVAENALQVLRQQTNWQERYRQLLQLGKQAPALADNLRTPERRIQGCEASVYLAVEQAADGLHYRFYSDARMVHALIYVALLPLQGQSATYAAHFDLPAWLECCGLAHHLSPSRGNGIRLITEAAKARASSLARPSV